MGILNVTPDSFYDGGKFNSEAEILVQVEKMVKEGADMIDVGGYSTRPGAKNVSIAEENERVLKAIRLIVRNFPGAIISVDTFRSEIARAAILEGAAMINDISGGQDIEMFGTVAELRVPYILMHMRGTPQTMTSLTKYTNLVKELLDYFHDRIHKLSQLGVTDIIVDPGFGFAKTREQNFVLLDQLEKFSLPGKPVLAGLSRKSMVWKTLNQKAEDALNGTTVLNTIALLKGARILRVHDVREAVEAVKLVNEMKHVISSDSLIS
jgi:dihydropteroate synthase